MGSYALSGLLLTDKLNYGCIQTIGLLLRKQFEQQKTIHTNDFCFVPPNTVNEQEKTTYAIAPPAMAGISLSSMVV